MSLDDLKKLESEAASFDSQNEKINHAIKILKFNRTSDTGYQALIDKLKIGSPYGSDVAYSALCEAINDVFLDCVRLAELRLTAKARENKLKAAQRRAVLNACIIEVPKVGEA